MQLDRLREEFIFDCRVRGLSPRTVRNYEKQTAYFLRFLLSKGITKVEDVTTLHIKSYINAQQERECKPSYINDLLKAVKCLFAYAYNEGYISTKVTKNVHNVKEPRVLIHTFSEREIKDMIEYYRGSNYLDIRNKLILMLLFDTGIRISELMNLKPEQIRDSYILIYGKGRKERIVPKSPIISKWLIKYFVARDKQFFCREAEDYVFLSKNGRKLTEEAICKFMKQAAIAVGVNPKVRVSPHTCRHTFAHQQLKNGLDLYSLSRLLGHESISITQVYLESIRDAEILTSAKKTGVLANIR